MERIQQNLERCDRPLLAERLGVLGLLSLFLAFNIVTFNSYPTIWCDEVWFAEPAVNLVRYGSFTTRIWQLQPFNTFPVVNCPLYPLALVPWLAAAGTSLLAVRSFNYALMAAAVYLCWVIMWRFGLVRSARLRLLAVVVLLLGYGMSYSYRCSRPDILGMLCLLLCVLAFAVRRRRYREIFLFTMAAASIWIGLQVALYAAVASLAAWLWLRRVGFRDLIVLGTGMLAGGISLALFLSRQGVLSSFLLIIGVIGKNNAYAGHLSFSGAVLKVLRNSLRNYVEDFSMLAVTLGLAVLLAAAWNRLGLATRRLAIYCLLLTFAVPPLFNLLGHFAFYYSYMRFVPAALALFAVYSDLLSARSGLNPVLRFIFGATIAGAMAVGLPLRLALSPVMYHLAPRSEIQRMLNARIAPNDVVFTDQAAFFEAKEITPAVYDVYSSPTFLHFPMPGSREFTAERKRSVSVLVIRPEQSQQVTNFFGGSWTAVSDLFGDIPNYQRLAGLPVIGGRLVHYAEQPQNIRRQLQIFRRLPTHSEAPAAARTSL